MYNKTPGHVPKLPAKWSRKNKGKLFIISQIMGYYNHFTYVGAPTYLLKSGAVINSLSIFDNGKINSTLGWFRLAA